MQVLSSLKTTDKVDKVVKRAYTIFSISCDVEYKRQEVTLQLAEGLTTFIIGPHL